MRALYITHPQVMVDPDVPVPQWGLSEVGRARAEAFAARGLIAEGAVVFSSDERKAVELADIITASWGGAVITDPAMGENDRSAMGFLPPDKFEVTADRFFAAPMESVDGWERAIDAQRRIVGAVGKAMERVRPGQAMVFCGHGAVGTLLKCYLGGWTIARSEDQRRMADPGGGNGFVFDLEARKLYCDWTPMEALTREMISG
ncbi:MAG: histidine phosphatase family protein [Devosia sp.]|uniref:histidine phosphatase family protein n=1 Tax=Devosia sp. TaxID=1871048 RepID=UPI002603D93D|nr:histidine phosphatase family protein [Devosia sp.]MDB5530786.1 histidine phosphatase family protein [Devosia sp.]